VAKHTVYWVIQIIMALLLYSIEVFFLGYWLVIGFIGLGIILIHGWCFPFKISFLGVWGTTFIFLRKIWAELVSYSFRLWSMYLPFKYYSSRGPFHARDSLQVACFKWSISDFDPQDLWFLHLVELSLHYCSWYTPQITT
jgi:hypothetical protein